MKKKRWLRAVLYLFFSLLCLLVLFPVFYTLSNSFMAPDEIMEHYQAVSTGNGQASFHFFAQSFSLQAYYRVFLATPNYLFKFWNSLLLCTVIVAGQALVSVMGGFAFAKYRFPGRRVWFLLIILFMIMPVQVTLLPNYIVLDKLKLLGTYGALILPAVFLPFGSFLMTLVFRGIPDEMLEAGRLDGAGTLRLLFSVMIPASKAGFASLITLCFIDNWNMVEQPIVFLDSKFRYPLSVFLASMSNENFALQFVCGILSLLPVTLLFFYLKDELAQGLDLSSSK